MFVSPRKERQHLLVLLYATEVAYGNIYGVLFEGDALDILLLHSLHS